MAEFRSPAQLLRMLGKLGPYEVEPEVPEKVDTAAVRSWAADNGYELSGRGRIPAEVLTAYRASTVKES